MLDFDLPRQWRSVKLYVSNVGSKSRILLFLVDNLVKVGHGGEVHAGKSVDVVMKAPGWCNWSSTVTDS